MLFFIFTLMMFDFKVLNSCMLSIFRSLVWARNYTQKITLFCFTRKRKDLNIICWNSFFFTTERKKMPKPGIKSKNLDLQDQCFTIKLLQADNLSASSYPENLFGRHIWSIKDSSTDWATGNWNTITQYQKDYRY